MPITFGVFVCGYLAIIGFPLFTGFFTKDKIIEAAFDKGGTSGCDPRHRRAARRRPDRVLHDPAMVMTFFGKRRWEDDVHPHESPPVDDRADDRARRARSLVGGFLLIFGGGVQHWLDAVGRAERRGGRAHDLAGRAIVDHARRGRCSASAGAVVAFGRQRARTVQPAGVSPVTIAARRNLYADAFNEAVFMRPGQWLTRALVFFDNRGVDGAVNGLAADVRRRLGAAAPAQTGFVRSYALSMLGGSVAVVAVLLAVRFL